MTHGTASNYARGCRCDECRTAKAAYDRERGYHQPSSRHQNWQFLRDLLLEIAPMGLTNDCPARALEKALTGGTSSTAGVNRPASSRTP